mgnify:FL=1
MYMTTSLEYAARYAAGHFDDPAAARPRTLRADGSVPVVLVCAAVGVAYPVTPQRDYRAKRKDGHSDFSAASCVVALTRTSRLCRRCRGSRLCGDHRCSTWKSSSTRRRRCCPSRSCGSGRPCEPGEHRRSEVGHLVTLVSDIGYFSVECFELRIRCDDTHHVSFVDFNSSDEKVLFSP